MVCAIPAGTLVLAGMGTKAPGTRAHFLPGRMYMKDIVDTSMHVHTGIQVPGT